VFLFFPQFMFIHETYRFTHWRRDRVARSTRVGRTGNLIIFRWIMRPFQSPFIDEPAEVYFMSRTFWIFSWIDVIIFKTIFASYLFFFIKFSYFNHFLFFFFFFCFMRNNQTTTFLLRTVIFMFFWFPRRPLFLISRLHEEHFSESYNIVQNCSFDIIIWNYQQCISCKQNQANL